ncbi:MAG TPA: DNA-3-methyladenine glycosylase 2 family protein [candidate division Zixibacteria bacterium]|nr:DNA-3-methyladenine glycosylase 2 family protein [candidate division Zixibacteria bacterium]
MNEIIDFLKKDKVLGKIIQKEGTITLRQSESYFLDLVETIIAQQISGKAANSIIKKFYELFKNKKPTPDLLLKKSEEELVSAGISKQKRGYLYSLAEKFKDKTITPDRFPEMADQEIIDELVQIKGIGKWSAQMFLMFTLRREDIFAPDDLGLRKALVINYDFEDLPKPKEAEKFAERWKPYRSYASLYLWKSVRTQEQKKLEKKADP